MWVQFIIINTLAYSSYGWGVDVVKRWLTIIIHRLWVAIQILPMLIKFMLWKSCKIWWDSSLFCTKWLQLYTMKTMYILILEQFFVEILRFYRVSVSNPEPASTEYVDTSIQQVSKYRVSNHHYSLYLRTLQKHVCSCKNITIFFM